MARLEADAQARLRSAFAPNSRGVLASALRSFAQFAERTPARELFLTPGNSDMNEHAMRAWNEWTLILYAQFMTMRVSPKTGKPVGGDTVSSYVSLVKGFFSFTYAFTLVAETPRLSRFIKALLHDDPLHGIRRKRRALRRRHLRRAWRRHDELRRTDPDTVNKWAALTTAWHCLARGGEVAAPSRRGSNGILVEATSCP